MAGYKGNANLLASSIQYIINVVMTIPALLFVDRWGRRPTLIIGAFFMMVWMFTNAGLLGGYGVVVPGGVGGIPEESMSLSGTPAKALIACTYLFVASYAPSWGPVSWIYPPELFPLRVRGKAVAMATSFNWIFNTALGAFTPPAFENIRWKVYLIFGLFNLAMLIHGKLLPQQSSIARTKLIDIFSLQQSVFSSQKPLARPWKRLPLCSKIQMEFLALARLRGRLECNTELLSCSSAVTWARRRVWLSTMKKFRIRTRRFRTRT